MAGDIHIGTSGWSYAHWENVLYPHGLLPRQRLDYYVRRFHTTELNSSYYRWPRDSAFSSWKRRLPDGFRLSVKAPGLLTHVRKLYGPERWLERITHSLSLLGDRAGPLLVQTSPHFAYDAARLRYFLEQLPTGRQFAFEFRHHSWHHEETFEMLERFGCAYCVMSGAHLPCILRATAPFVYIRLHGPHPDFLYAGSYSDNDLRWWADRIREWSGQGREIFAYFNNDGEGNAVRNADTLRYFVGA